MKNKNTSISLIIVAAFLVLLFMASCKEEDLNRCNCDYVMHENNKEIHRSSWNFDFEECQGYTVDEVVTNNPDGTKNYTRTEIQCE